MKLSHQILMASAITLASVVAPRFVDAARHIGEMVGNSVNLNALTTFGRDQMHLRPDAELPDVPPQKESGLATLTSHG